MLLKIYKIYAEISSFSARSCSWDEGQTRWDLDKSKKKKDKDSTPRMTPVRREGSARKVLLYFFFFRFLFIFNASM